MKIPKLFYLAFLFVLMLLHIEWEAHIWEGHFIWDPLLLTMPGLFVSQLYIVGELLERYLRDRKDGAMLRYPY